MAEKDKSAGPTDSPPPEYINEHVNATTGELELPSGWMYRRFKIGRFMTPWYASPKFQLGTVAFVCFMCPGMFNALGGLGGGGRQDPHLVDKMNIALYSTFAVVGFVAGSIVNRLGVRLTIAFGGLGYCIYAISLLVSLHAHADGFNIFAGVFLGICAGLLWSAQGAIMMSYPTEAQKGRYWAWFWGIFNVGACIGSLIPLGQTADSKESTVSVGDGTYIAFIVLMFFGAILGLCLCNADNIIRSDGSRVILMKNPSWISEVVGLWDTLLAEPFVILLFPMFWSSNWFYTYQPNCVNAAHFNIRTRSLNSFLYWFAQILAAMTIGPLLDIDRVRRTTRARISLCVLFCLTMAIWGGGYAYQKKYTRESVNATDFVPTDWTTSGYVGPMFLYLFYGFFDAVWQGTVYWYMGALANSGRKLANLAGFYKGLQSAGAAVAFSIDYHEASYMTEFATNWGLLAGSLVIAIPVVFMRIKDHVPVEEDLKGTNETLASILPVGHPEKQAATAMQEV